MTKKFQLNIAEPCHENWENMSPVDKARPDGSVGRGKFCGSCQKQVVDFSNMSDRQVADFFKKPSTGSVCGRFMADQLDRPIEIPRKRIPWVKYFFQFALPAFLMSMKVSAQKTKGTVSIITRDTVKKVKVKNDVMMLGEISPVCILPFKDDTIITAVDHPVDNIKGDVSMVVTDLSKRSIIGKVTDEKGDPLPGVSIIIKGTVFGISADSLGHFRIKAKKGDILVISHADFETTEVDVGTKVNIEVVLRKNYIYENFKIGLIDINMKPEKKILEMPLLKSTEESLVTKSIKAYPNPVTSGSNLSVEWKQNEEGYYSLEFVNLSGQSLYQREIWIDAEAGILYFKVPSIASGSYFLMITNKKNGQKYFEKIILQ